MAGVERAYRLKLLGARDRRGEVSVKRFVIRSLCASTIALFSLLVTAAASSGVDCLPDPDSCSPAPGRREVHANRAESPPGRTGTSGSPRRTGTGSAASPPAGRSPSSRSRSAEQPAGRDHAGPRRALWFTEFGRQQDRRAITTAGAITEYEFPVAAPARTASSLGPTATLWFTESGAATGSAT